MIIDEYINVHQIPITVSDLDNHPDEKFLQILDDLLVSKGVLRSSKSTNDVEKPQSIASQRRSFEVPICKPHGEIPTLAELEVNRLALQAELDRLRANSITSGADRLEMVEVEHGIKVSKSIVDFATSSSTTCDVPRHYSAQQKELYEDVKVGREIVNSLTKPPVDENSRRYNARKLTPDGKFVPMTDTEFEEAAANYKSMLLEERRQSATFTPDIIVTDEVMNLCATTKPLVDNVVDSIVHTFTVEQITSTDDILESIRFIVTDPSGEETVQRYVHMNSLPVELKAVVISCLKLARKEIDLKDFKHEVANFAALVESMK